MTLLTHNYKNQRVSKSVNNKTTYYIYDDYKLIGEYNEDGTAIKEYIYLDDTPIAILEDNKVYYIYADHLNTPRRVATSQDYTIVWKWESKPFGEDKPTGTYELNLRFPGQYFDIESGFSYNINRYYNPKLGRYMQSDPIGLEGGENSYLYADANPLVKYDATRECPWCARIAVLYAIKKARDLLIKAGFDVEIARHPAHHKFNGCYKEHYQMRIINHKLTE